MPQSSRGNGRRGGGKPRDRAHHEGMLPSAVMGLVPASTESVHHDGDFQKAIVLKNLRKIGIVATIAASEQHSHVFVGSFRPLGFI